MTRVLVVHHDLDLAGQEADSLRRFVYDVIECGGPTRSRCPVLAGHPCDPTERADVLVYDVWASGDAEWCPDVDREHPRDPSGHTRSADIARPPAELGGEHRHAICCDPVARPTDPGARLHEAIQTALSKVTEPATDGAVRAPSVGGGAERARRAAVRVSPTDGEVGVSSGGATHERSVRM